jgi:hypothetical protein
MKIVWYDEALDDWRRLSLSDAEVVARAVESWANTNEGVVAAVDDAFLLFVGEHVVVFFVHDDVMHIAHVRRA